MTTLSSECLTKKQLRAEAAALVSALGKSKRRRANKYNAVRTIIDGVSFHSKREASAWSYLKIRERAGEIRDLKRQVPFKLCAYGKNGEPVYCTTYVADFQYFDVKQVREIVSDAKGVKTALFSIKAKMMLACHGIEVELV